MKLMYWLKGHSRRMKVVRKLALDIGESLFDVAKVLDSCDGDYQQARQVMLDMRMPTQTFWKDRASQSTNPEVQAIMTTASRLFEDPESPALRASLTRQIVHRVPNPEDITGPFMRAYSEFLKQ